MKNASTFFGQDELSRSIKIFLTDLPDANTYKGSSIEEDFIIEGKEVKLYASKTRGMEGLIWNINILD